MVNAMNEKAILDEIRQAYEKREIKAYFQPIYDALSGKVVSAEALSRWIKTDGTVVLPGAYIPVLEATDAICELDWYMLREVCSALKEQKEAGIPRVKVSVNFSRKHVMDDVFVAKLCNVTDEYDIPHKLIQVELTESALIESTTEQIGQLVDAIREKGFTVAIDDFGSGMSSLGLVKDVAFDTLKVDRSLLSKNCEEEKERIVLESILEFAHRLKMITVVEGVETGAQLGFLRTCGCKMIQGFYFSKPLPKETFFEVCKSDTGKELTEDILQVQSQASAVQLLLDAVYTRYPLIIYVNLTRNSYYMMKYDDFTRKTCISAGVFDDCIAHGASTMHPEDQEAFRSTFCIENQLKVYERGEKYLSLVVRQQGDDGVYRRVEVTNYFVKNPSAEDVLVISLSHNLD